MDPLDQLCREQRLCGPADKASYRVPGIPDKLFAGEVMFALELFTLKPLN